MKLIELITYFRNGGSFESFCQSRSLDQTAEVIEIYMEKPFDLSNELAFFEIEKTEGKIEHIYNGIKFYNMFDFYYFLDTMEEANNEQNKSLTDNDLGKLLLNYAINNA